MALINNSNIKKIIKKNKDLLADFLKLGYEDHRLWTGLPSHEMDEIDADELSGRAPIKKIRLGDTVYIKDRNYNSVPVTVIAIRHLDKPSSDGVTWVIDWVFEKDKSHKLIHSLRAQNLFKIK